MEMSRFLCVDLMNYRTNKKKVFTKIVSGCDNIYDYFPRGDMLIAHPNVILDKWVMDVEPEFSICLDDKLHVGDGTRPSIIHSENITDINIHDYMQISEKLKENGFRFNKKTGKIIKVDK